MENNSSMTRWQNMFFSYKSNLIFGSHCNHFFWDSENLKITLLYYALNSARANKIFQKRTVFVFTESWSCDQLMQKKVDHVIN